MTCSFAASGCTLVTSILIVIFLVFTPPVRTQDLQPSLQVSDFCGRYSSCACTACHILQVEPSGHFVYSAVSHGGYTICSYEGTVAPLQGCLTVKILPPLPGKALKTSLVSHYDSRSRPPLFLVPVVKENRLHLVDRDGLDVFLGRKEHIPGTYYPCDLCREDEKIPPAAILSSCKQTPPQPGVSKEAHLQKARELMALGEPEQAIDSYDAAIALCPQDPELYCQRAVCRRMVYQCDLACADYNKAIALDPYYKKALLERVTLHELLDDQSLYSYKQQIDDYNTLIRLDPECKQALLGRAQAQAAQKHGFLLKGEWGLGIYGSPDPELQQSLDDYDRVISLDPGCLEAYIGRSDICWLTGDYDGAAADLSRVISLSATNTKAYRRRIGVYRLLRKYKEAAEDFATLVSLEPNNKEVHVERAKLFEQMGQHDKFLQYMTDGINVTPKPVSALDFATIAEDYDRVGEYHKVIDCYNKLLELLEHPDPLVFFNRGLEYDRLGQYQKAIDDYSRYLSFAQEYGDPEVLALRGAVFAALAQPEKALRDYTSALALDETLPEALLGRAGVYMNLKRKKEAIADYSRILALGSSSLQCYCNSGIVSGSVGNAIMINRLSPCGGEAMPQALQQRAVRVLAQLKRSCLYGSPRADTVAKALLLTHLDRARAYLQDGQYRKCIADCTTTISQDPECAEGYLTRALAYDQLHKDRASKRDRDRAEELEGKRPAAIDSSPRY